MGSSKCWAHRTVSALARALPLIHWGRVSIHQTVQQQPRLCLQRRTSGISMGRIVWRHTPAGLQPVLQAVVGNCMAVSAHIFLLIRAKRKQTSLIREPD